MAACTPMVRAQSLAARRSSLSQQADCAARHGTGDVLRAGAGSLPGTNIAVMPERPAPRAPTDFHES